MPIRVGSRAGFRVIFLVRPDGFARMRGTPGRAGARGTPKWETWMSAKLDADAIEDWLKDRDGWKHRGDALEKNFSFDSFRSSIVFVNRIATLADSADHHPDIDIRYDKVKLTLSTHDAGGITEKDLELARSIDFATSAR